MSDLIKMVSVDDKSLLTSLDRMAFKKMGVQVQSVVNYLEIESLLKKGYVDIVVINMDFGEIDPLLICKSLKESTQWGQIPVIMTSVGGQARRQKLALGAGADLFIEQPMPRSYFVEQVKSLLYKDTRGSGGRVNQDLGDAKLKFDSEELVASMLDLSVSGVLIACERELEIGAEVEMFFTVSSSNKKIKVKGEVVRKVTPKDNRFQVGFGVRFTEYDSGAENELKKFMSYFSLDEMQMAYYL